MKNLRISSDLDYLREPKTPNKSEKLTENIEDKYLDTKKPFPKYTDAVAYLATKKQAGGLLDRLNKEKEQGASQAQEIGSKINSAVDKFRSLVFEVKGSEQLIEVAKEGANLIMKVFADKDSPTPVSEKYFNAPSFLDYFMKKLAPANPDQVAQDLANKGITEVSKPVVASVIASLSKKASYPPLQECKLKKGDVIQVHGFVMLKNLDAGKKYKVALVKETPQGTVYWFCSASNKACLPKFGHYVCSVDGYIQDANSPDINKIVKLPSKSDPKTVAK